MEKAFRLEKYAVSEPSFARLRLNIAQQPLPVPVLAANYRHAFELYVRRSSHEFITLDTKCSICKIIHSSHGLESIFIASWYVQLLVK